MERSPVADDCSKAPLPKVQFDFSRTHTPLGDIRQVQGDMCTCHRLAAPLSIAPKCRSTVALLNY